MAAAPAVERKMMILPILVLGVEEGEGAMEIGLSFVDLGLHMWHMGLSLKIVLMRVVEVEAEVVPFFL